MLYDQTPRPATFFGTEIGQTWQKSTQRAGWTYLDAAVAGHKGHARYANGESDRSYTRNTNLTVEEEDSDGYLHRVREQVINFL
jgi:hypothetical protein